MNSELRIALVDAARAAARLMRAYAAAKENENQRGGIG
jgi:hypothetical protein